MTIFFDESVILIAIIYRSFHTIISKVRIRFEFKYNKEQVSFNQPAPIRKLDYLFSLIII